MNMNSIDLPEPIALVDMDGTLANFTKGMANALKPLEGPGEQWDYDSYDQDNEPSFMKERRRLVKRRPGFWRELEPIQSGFAILSLLVELDFQITIFTKAPMNNPPAFMEKAQWCEKHLAGFSGWKLSMVQDKGLHYGKVLVDDWPLYIERWVQYRPRGRVIMPVHKYNKSFEHPQVTRYHGGTDTSELGELRKMLETIRKQCRP